MLRNMEMLMHKEIEKQWKKIIHLCQTHKPIVFSAGCVIPYG